MTGISFVVVGKTLYQTKVYKDFGDGANKKIGLKKRSRILLLICPVTYSGSTL